jgi:signal transduction histidine kinase
VDNAARRMLRMLDQFGRGATTGLARRIDVATFCRDAVRRCQDRVPSPALIAPEGPLEVAADGERLMHVLEHVIRNAQEATPASGRVTVTVSGSATEVAINVADTGCGMDARFVRDRLFRPFDSTKGSQGMGVGAYQAREFVLAAGGSVDITSAPGDGTTFRIFLPRVVAAHAVAS